MKQVQLLVSYLTHIPVHKGVEVVVMLELSFVTNDLFAALLY